MVPKPASTTDKAQLQLVLPRKHQKQRGRNPLRRQPLAMILPRRSAARFAFIRVCGYVNLELARADSEWNHERACTPAEKRVSCPSHPPAEDNTDSIYEMFWGVYVKIIRLHYG